MKKSVICSSILLSVVLISLAGYFGYGATMVNFESESSIKSHLSKDKSRPINILAKKECEDGFLILYTDPVLTEVNANSCCFSYFKRHQFYSNRYVYKGGTAGNQTEATVNGIELNRSAETNNKVTIAVANTATDETKCSVFEFNGETGAPVNRLDVIEVPQNEPYIIIKEYMVSSENSMVGAYDGEIELQELT